MGVEFSKNASIARKTLIGFAFLAIILLVRLQGLKNLARMCLEVKNASLMAK
jgi:hypothetical protein